VLKPQSCRALVRLKVLQDGKEATGSVNDLHSQATSDGTGSDKICLMGIMIDVKYCNVYWNSIKRWPA